MNIQGWFPLVLTVGCRFLPQGVFSGIKPSSPVSPALAGRFFTPSHLGSPRQTSFFNKTFLLGIKDYRFIIKTRRKNGKIRVWMTVISPTASRLLLPDLTLCMCFRGQGRVGGGLQIDFTKLWIRFILVRLTAWVSSVNITLWAVSCIIKILIEHVSLNGCINFCQF